MYNEYILADMRGGNIYLFGHCNTGIASTNKKGRFGSIENWINQERILNIFNTPKLEEIGFHIIYNSMDGHYIFHTKNG